MAITTTTLAQDITGYATRLLVASTANMVIPMYASGTSSYLYCEQECMFVTDVPASGTVTVERGALGTHAVAHANGTAVIVGLAADFPIFPVSGTTPQTMASGTATLGTSAINSGASATLVTVAAPGVLPTDNMMADFNGDPKGRDGLCAQRFGDVDHHQVSQHGQRQFCSRKQYRQFYHSRGYHAELEGDPVTR